MMWNDFAHWLGKEITSGNLLVASAVFWVQLLVLSLLCYGLWTLTVLVLKWRG
jgi:hypothetical protein